MEGGFLGITLSGRSQRRATTGKWDRMTVAGPGIGKEYKPDESGKEGQSKGQMNKNSLLHLFLGLFVRSVSSEDLIREGRTSLPAPHLHHVISQLSY